MLQQCYNDIKTHQLFSKNDILLSTTPPTFKKMPFVLFDICLVITCFDDKSSVIKIQESFAFFLFECITIIIAMTEHFDPTTSKMEKTRCGINLSPCKPNEVNGGWQSNFGYQYHKTNQLYNQFNDLFHLEAQQNCDNYETFTFSKYVLLDFMDKDKVIYTIASCLQIADIKNHWQYIRLLQSNKRIFKHYENLVYINFQVCMISIVDFCINFISSSVAIFLFESLIWSLLSLLY